MCGIAGIISSKNDLNGKDFYKAIQKITHRGRDDEGYFYTKNDDYILNAKGSETIESLQCLENIKNIKEAKCIFGHKRLSIIELGANGHQPFIKHGLALTYNGEIFNYLELRKELENEGCIFETETDTEVFITAFYKWGNKAFTKFNGMWAAAIYDIHNKKVTLTRDRFGIKPLYFCLDNNKLYFSSEIKFFLPYSLLKNVNEEAVYNYLRHSITDSNADTFFSNIFQVEPGQYIEYKNQNVTSFYYWTYKDFGGVLNPKNQVEETLIDSIALRLRSDVKVGSLLSGGIDSSLIVGIINEYIRVKNFNTFSAVFDKDIISEKPYIEKTINKMRLKPNYIYPNTDNFKSKIQKLIYIQEMPFRSLSVLSQYSIYEHISKNTNIKVLLNGQGADEIFSGYTNHYAIYLISLLKRGKIFHFQKELKALKFRKKTKYMKLLPWIFKVLISNTFDTGDKYKISKNKYKSLKKIKIFNKKSFFKSNLLNGVQRSALREYLRYEDRNSMHFGLEARLPFLDFRLVKLAFSIKDEDLILNANTKAPLRKFAKKLLPEEVTNRVDKAGFPSPQERWQRNELKIHFDETFEEIRKQGIFSFLDTQNILKVYDDYCSKNNNDWGFVWRIYCLYQWKKVWLN